MSCWQSLNMQSLDFAAKHGSYCTHDKLVVEEHLDEIEDILHCLYGVIVPVCPASATAPSHAGIDRSPICLN